MIMKSHFNVTWFVWILFIFDQTSSVCFCPNATWNPNATTFANSSIIGGGPYGFSISSNNIVYIPNQSNKYLLVLSETSLTPLRNIPLNSSDVVSIFAREDDSIYIGYTWNSISGIRKLTSNLSSSDSVLEVWSRCRDIFIDIHDYIYCSLDYAHQVIKKSLNNTSDPIRVIAGTGTASSASNMLYNPNGIFVDTNFDLYVADHGNNRIQFFPLDQSNGITVAGSGSLTVTIALNYPCGIILDDDKYLFISERIRNRVIRSGPYGFQCLFGCSGGGSATDQLNYPMLIKFDMFGNIFVADSSNNRLQKFVLMTNSCSKLN